MTCEYDQLLRTILENPEDDLVRLVFADWLEENGEEERAEFIRLGIHLIDQDLQRQELLDAETDWTQCTGISASWCPNCGNCSCKDREVSMSDDGCPIHSSGSRHCCHTALVDQSSTVAKRYKEIAGWYEAEWSKPLCIIVGHDQEPVSGLRWNFHRGFISEVSLPLAAFLSHARELFKTHPIERIVLTDREPGKVWDDTSAWFVNYITDSALFENPDDLPEDLLELLTGYCRRTDDQLFLSRHYDTAQDAKAALSTACIAYGREQAGLPAFVSAR